MNPKRNQNEPEAEAASKTSDSQDISLNYVRLLGGFVLCSALIFCLMLLHHSDPAPYFGRYTASYLVSLAIVFTMGLAAGLSILGLRWKGPQLFRFFGLLFKKLPTTAWFGFLIIGVGLVAIGLFWRFFGSWQITGPILFRIYIVGVICTLVIAILHGTRTLYLSLANRWLWLCLAAVLITVLALTVRYNGHTPPSRYFDEPWDLNWSWTIAETHSFYTFIFPGVSGADMAMASVLRAAVGYWMELVGVGLAQGRLFYLLFGWLAVPFVYLTARQLYGKIAGLYAAVLVAFLPLLHTYMRPDGVVGTAIAAGLYFYFSARVKNALWRHFFAGLCIGLTIEGHPYGVCFIGALGLLYLVEYIQLIWRARRWQWNPAFWCFIFGLVIYGAFFAFAHLAIAPGGLANVTRIFGKYQSETQISGTSDPVQRLASVAPLFYENYFTGFSVEIVFFVLGLAGLIYRHRPDDVRLFAVWSLGFGALIVIMAHYSPYYYQFYLPFVGLFGGSFLAQITQSLVSSKDDSLKPRPFRMISVVILGLIVVLFSAHTSLTASPGQSADEFMHIGALVDRLLPPDMPIAGWQAYYFGMPYRKSFVATENFIFFGQPDKWNSVPPQAILLTVGLDDQQKVINQYIVDHQLQKAYCFPTHLFGPEAILYTMAAYVPVGGPQNCAADVQK